MEKKLEQILKKYTIYRSNLQWHLDTNKPGEGEVVFFEQRITDFSEIIADLQSLSHSQNKVDSQEGEWISVEKDLPPQNTVVLGYSKEWIDEDFEPEGIREALINGDGEWQSAKWCNCHDDWSNDDETKPTHWMQRPAPPLSNPVEPKQERMKCSCELELEFCKTPSLCVSDTL